MRLVINANPVSQSNLFITNGSEIVKEYRVMGPDMIDTIDQIFATYYIEAVYFNSDNNYTRKFGDYIETAYRNVEVIY